MCISKIIKSKSVQFSIFIDHKTKLFRYKTPRLSFINQTNERNMLTKKDTAMSYLV